MKLVKGTVRSVEREDACIVVDDFLIEKPHSTQNAIININWDYPVEQPYSRTSSATNTECPSGSRSRTTRCWPNWMAF